MQEKIILSQKIIILGHSFIINLHTVCAYIRYGFIIIIFMLNKIKQLAVINKKLINLASLILSLSFLFNFISFKGDYHYNLILFLLVDMFKRAIDIKFHD
jgi:hypothetical protein